MGRVKEKGVVPRTERCQGPRKVSWAHLFPFSTDGEARTFNGSIELCRADSDSSQKVGLRRCQDLARGWERNSWPIDPDTELSGTGPGKLCLLIPHPCLFLQDRNGNQLRSPQEVRRGCDGIGD